MKPEGKRKIKGIKCPVCFGNEHYYFPFAVHSRAEIITFPDGQSTSVIAGRHTEEVQCTFCGSRYKYTWQEKAKQVIEKYTEYTDIEVTERVVFKPKTNAGQRAVEKRAKEEAERKAKWALFNKNNKCRTCPRTYGRTVNFGHNDVFHNVKHCGVFHTMIEMEFDHGGRGINAEKGCINGCPIWDKENDNEN